MRPRRTLIVLRTAKPRHPRRKSMDTTIERRGPRLWLSRLRSFLAAVAVLLAVGCSAEAGELGPAARVAPIAALGSMLFLDRALSADGQVSCASCHQPERAYSDGLAHASGVAGQHGTRNTPSLLDVGRQRSLFWDGRRTRLEDQALDPLLNRVEHGLRDPAELLARLRSYTRYAVPVLLAYGIPMDQLSVPQVTEALAAFERTLQSAPSPFDRFLAGQLDAMSQSARQGWVVFDQKVHCTRCHVVAGDGQPALFTDHRFHSLTVGFSKVERKLPELTKRLVTLRSERGAVGGDVLDDADIAALGRFVVTLDPHDVGAFKTPGLRNVARTGPYMHDGSVATLVDAVDLELYARGARDDRPPILTPAERDDLVAFLQALTSNAAPGEGRTPCPPCVR
ncbi:MAG TPA: cytochrome c peroxidase [Kofleriaceae bacterium]|nr:cytochrome c peroxidase [Kofleriaceae bacterium]